MDTRDSTVVKHGRPVHPREMDAATRTATKRAARMMAGTPRAASVLVVDHDAVTRGLITYALRRAGLKVIDAETGKAALHLVLTKTIALVILDVAMPGMPGTDIVQALRIRPETATLPVLLMTGSGDYDSVVEGLDAGADDFLPKPVRLDELVARVQAHLRTQAAWSGVVEAELRIRAGVVAALGRLVIPSSPEDAAEAVVNELAKRTASDLVAVLQLGAGDQLHELATYDRAVGVRRCGRTLPAAQARTILARARSGPWVDEVQVVGSADAAPGIASASTELSAGAPIYSGDDLVGILTIGVGRSLGRSPLVHRAKLLAAAIDYANVLSTRTGSAFADRRDIAATRARLRSVVTAGRFHPVFQRIVELETGAIVGFEALTRFDDDTPPDQRFAEAVAAGLGRDFELATMRAALDQAARLPADGFLSINVSPGFVLRGHRQLRQLVAASPRRIVLELTEHVPIADYASVRKALARIGASGLAIDDAGAGYASLRHVLELRPAFAKLDISLVRGIDGDDLRQALATGLQFFAFKSGCRLVAEGVETHAEAETLQRLGILLGQGYLFGRPERIA